MKFTIEGLFGANAVLSRGLLGVDVVSGARVEPIKELPTSIFRHLRRLHRAIKDELEIISPDHREFMAKWGMDGKFPTPESENFKEFLGAYNEFFGEIVTIPFSPFHLDVLDELKIVCPVDIQNLMENVNEVIAEELESEKEPPATADTDNGPSSPDANA